MQESPSPEQERTGRWAGAIGVGKGPRSARRRRRGRAGDGRGGELGIWGRDGGDFNASRKRLKEHLTCGAHTSVSGGEKQRRVFWSIRKMCTGIRPDSGPKHPKDVENGKYQVEEEL